MYIIIEISSSTRLQSFADARATEMHSLVKALFQDTNNHAGISKKVEIKPRLFELILNVMMKMIAGKRYYGEKATATEKEEAMKFKKVVEQAFLLLGASNLGDFLPFLRWLDFQGVFFFNN